MIRVLIVEELPILLAGLRMRLSAEADISVIGEASDFDTGLDLAMRLSPDIVVLDVDPPFGNTLLTASQLCQLCRSATVILLAMNDDRETHTRIQGCGAAGCVSKYMPVATLVAAIRRVAACNAGGGWAAPCSA